MFTRIKTQQAIHRPAVTGAASRQLDVKLTDALSVKDFGATGDGTANDSAAIQACITAAQAAGKAVHFPDGTYVISSLGNQTGRLIMHGSGNATLKGTFTYQQASFPTSADTLTPLTPTAPYFHASGLNFESTTTGYALQLFTNEQPNFISTFSLTGCRFYGNKGLLARHMIGFELTHCEFNNKVAGARFESCANGALVSCRWQNQAESGVWITSASDQTLRSPGGENIKFVLCEWAVCSFGIVAEQHMWLTIDSCLLDYCTMPLYLSGSHYAKASQTYFGAANTPVSRFSGVPGYLAPGLTGVAVYGRPGGTPLGSRVVGFTAHNCEFINYTAGSTQPMVYIDGYVNATYNMSGEEVSFYDCLFYATASHSAPNLLEISYCKIVRVIGNRFVSVDKSTSMANAYRMNQCMSPLGHSNDFYHCRQNGVIVGSASEKMLASVYVQSTDPGAIGAGNIWVQP